MSVKIVFDWREEMINRLLKILFRRILSTDFCDSYNSKTKSGINKTADAIPSLFRLFVFIFLFCSAALLAEIKEGVTTHAPHRHWYALNERFRHARGGVLQTLSFN